MIEAQNKKKNCIRRDSNPECCEAVEQKLIFSTHVFANLLIVRLVNKTLLPCTSKYFRTFNEFCQIHSLRGNYCGLNKLKKNILGFTSTFYNCKTFLFLFLSFALVVVVVDAAVVVVVSDVVVVVFDIVVVVFVLLMMLL